MRKLIILSLVAFLCLPGTAYVMQLGSTELELEPYLKGGTIA